MTIPSGNSKRARQAAWLFAIGGIVILAAGVLRVRGLLYQPFQTRGEAAPIDFSAGGQEAIDPKLDTDQDGLTDVEELNHYFTSPFLKDTDSDGATDSEEIKKGTDPTCPEGKDCAKTAAEPPEQKLQPGEIVSPSASSNPGSLADFLNLSGLSETAEQLDPQKVRESLKVAGIAPAVLDKLSDAEVVELYKTTVASLGATPEQIAAADPVKLISPQGIRALLVRAGIDAKTLEKLTDEQLVRLVEETLKGDMKK